MYTLEGLSRVALQTSLLLMKSLNKIETPIFYMLCALCFQRQSFRRLFYRHNRIVDINSYN